jgi:hypothetical protein
MEHLMDTNRRMQDHELRQFLASRAQIRFGYAAMTRPGRSSSPNKVNGATSVLSWFRNERHDWNEYRLGADLDFFGVKLTLSNSGISTKMAHLHGRAEYDTPALGSERPNELRDGPRDFALSTSSAHRGPAQLAHHVPDGGGR